MSDKAPDAFRNISEVSEQLNVPSHVLRFWETRFSQIKPVKRSGGRRYYRPGDIALLIRIRDLLYAEGYTIKGAQQVLKSKQEGLPADAVPQRLLRASFAPLNCCVMPACGCPVSKADTTPFCVCIWLLLIYNRFVGV